MTAKELTKQVLKTRPGQQFLSSDLVEDLVRWISEVELLSDRTKSAVQFDLLRVLARLKNSTGQHLAPEAEKLHFGCGSRRVEGWLNVDVIGSDHDVDLASGSLPWTSNSFRTMVSQHTVEHLELHKELIPLFKELKRVARPEAEIWISCPDLERICHSYCEQKGVDLLEDRLERWPSFETLIPGDPPPQHIVNSYFHQWGKHKNLYDFELLTYALEEGGFRDCTRVSEEEFAERFPEFPRRHDDYHSLYVRARAGEG